MVQAWYPGIRGGEAIANVLFGAVNPSGHLPITFPKSESDLPRPVVDGFATLEPNFSGAAPTPDAVLIANYEIEGSDVGYRWNAREGKKALFPFGFGLSYTDFARSDFTTDGKSASVTITNTGKRAGATVAQVYLVSRDGKPLTRLVGFQRVELAAGESRTVSMKFDPRLLAEWNGKEWTIASGKYAFASGSDAETLGAPITVSLSAKSWRD